MAAPMRMLASEPHNATCESQPRICWISAAPGIPVASGFTLTGGGACAITRSISASLVLPVRGDPDRSPLPIHVRMTEQKRDFAGADRALGTQRVRGVRG